MVGWDAEKPIWDRLFQGEYSLNVSLRPGAGRRLDSSAFLVQDPKLNPTTYCFAQVDPSSTSLLVTEPYNNLPAVQAGYDQMVFEEYEFESYHRCTRQSPIDLDC